MKQAKALRNHNTGRGCAAAAALLFFIFAMELTAFAAESGGAALAAKTTNMSIAYGITTALSLFLFVGYCALVRQKNIWLRMTYGSVVIVNLGYLALSVSKTLEEALLADILLIVSDGASEEMLHQHDVVLEVLSSLGAQDRPMIDVVNKVDLLENRPEWPGAFFISA